MENNITPTRRELELERAHDAMPEPVAVDADGNELDAQGRIVVREWDGTPHGLTPDGRHVGW